MVVANAHRVTDASGEGFAVRLYRDGRAAGPLAAFSDAPPAFRAGLGRLERVMRALRLRRLLLYPRFRASVAADLEADPAGVEDWACALGDAQRALLEAAVAVLRALLRDLARSHRVDTLSRQTKGGGVAGQEPLDVCRMLPCSPGLNTLRLTSLPSSTAPSFLSKPCIAQLGPQLGRRRRRAHAGLAQRRRAPPARRRVAHAAVGRAPARDRLGDGAGLGAARARRRRGDVPRVRVLGGQIGMKCLDRFIHPPPTH